MHRDFVPVLGKIFPTCAQARTRWQWSKLTMREVDKSILRRFFLPAENSPQSS